MFFLKCIPAIIVGVIVSMMLILWLSIWIGDKIKARKKKDS